MEHNAVTNRYREGYQAVCLGKGCSWRGPLRKPSQVVREDIAWQKAQDQADEDSELHDEAMRISADVIDKAAQ